MDKNVIKAFCLMSDRKKYAVMRDYDFALKSFWNFVFLKDLALNNKEVLEHWEEQDNDNNNDIVHTLRYYSQPTYGDYIAAFNRFNIDYSSIYDKLVDPRTLIDEASVKMLMDSEEVEDY